MELFNIDGRQIIAINPHEYANIGVNIPSDETEIALNSEDVLKLQGIQGVTVMEVASADGFAVVVDSRHQPAH